MTQIALKPFNEQMQSFRDIMRKEETSRIEIDNIVRKYRLRMDEKYEQTKREPTKWLDTRKKRMTEKDLDRAIRCREAKQETRGHKLRLAIL